MILRAFGSVLTVTAVLNRAKGWTNFAQEVKNTSKVLQLLRVYLAKINENQLMFSGVIWLY